MAQTYAHAPVRQTHMREPTHKNSRRSRCMCGCTCIHARICALTNTHLRAHTCPHARERTLTHTHQIGPGFVASPLVCSGMGCRPCLSLHVGRRAVQAKIPCFSLRDARVPASPREPATSGPDTISMPMSHDRLVLACLFACLPVCLLT